MTGKLKKMKMYSSRVVAEWGFSPVVSYRDRDTGWGRYLHLAPDPDTDRSSESFLAEKTPKTNQNLLKQYIIFL